LSYAPTVGMCRKDETKIITSARRGSHRIGAKVAS